MKIKKVVIKPFYFYFCICGFFPNIIIYIKTFYKQIKIILRNWKYLFIVVTTILVAKTINVPAIICIYFFYYVFFTSCLPFVITNRRFFA